MKILHAPVDIAGQVALSAFGLREIGYVAHAFFPPHPFQYDLSPDYRLRFSRRWLARFEKLLYASWFAVKYDIFHFHFAQTFLGERLNYLDARLLRRVGRCVFIEFWGSDVRLPSVEAQRNPYYINSYAENDKTNRTRMQQWAEITGGHVIVSDHSLDVFLEPYFPHIHVVGQRVDTRRLMPNYPDPGKVAPIVVHAPSQRAFKGTEYVQRAVDNLKSRGLRFDYREVHGLPHRQARKLYSQADLVIDQVRGGAHGVFAVEAMSLGKPVICYILPELLPTYPQGFPIINANPDTLESVLEDWLQRPIDLYKLGLQSRKYAERVHDCRVVAAKLIAIYRHH